MREINYKSDFKIAETHDESILNAPFKFTYYIEGNDTSHVASYDGEKFNNCRYESGRLIIAIKGSLLGIGAISVIREFYLNDDDFQDGKCDIYSSESTDIYLGDGYTDVEGDVEIELFPYYQKGDKGDTFTYADMTEEDKKDLASYIDEDAKKELSITGTLNVTDISMIAKAQSDINKTGGAALYIIADSEGNVPSSKQNAVSVSAECIRQLSCASPNNSIQQILLNNISSDSFKSKGMSVGDIIALARVSVDVDVLANALGLSSTVLSALKIALNLVGALSNNSIEIYQYKVWSTTGTKYSGYTNPDGTVIPEGVEGLMSVYDVDLLGATAKTTKYNYGTPIDSLLKNGVLAYTSDKIDGIVANWTIFVDCAATPDSGGYYHLTQTAICRDYPIEGKMYTRFGYYKGEGEDLHFTEWKSMEGGSGGSFSGNASDVQYSGNVDATNVKEALDILEEKKLENYSRNILMNSNFELGDSVDQKYWDYIGLGGSSSGDSITENGYQNYRSVYIRSLAFGQTVSLKEGVTYTFSCYYKADTNSYLNYGYSLGHAINYENIVPQNQGLLLVESTQWQRASFTFVAGSNAVVSFANLSSSSNSGLHLSCMQLEEGDVPTKYYKLEDNYVTVARLAEVVDEMIENSITNALNTAV